MNDQLTEARRKPGPGPFLGMGLVGLTMFSVVGIFFNQSSLGVRTFCVAYFALGAFLLWRRWRPLP